MLNQKIKRIKVLWFSVPTSFVVIAMKKEEKIKSLVKFCIAHQRTGKTGRCAKIIGRSLSECEATIEDIKIAKLLLSILEGEEGVKR